MEHHPTPLQEGIGQILHSVRHRAVDQMCLCLRNDRGAGLGVDEADGTDVNRCTRRLLLGKNTSDHRSRHEVHRIFQADVEEFRC